MRPSPLWEWANGRPFSIRVRECDQFGNCNYNTYYYRYNWRGDPQYLIRPDGTIKQTFGWQNAPLNTWIQRSIWGAAQNGCGSRLMRKSLRGTVGVPRWITAAARRYPYFGYCRREDGGEDQSAPPQRPSGIPD